MDWDKFVDEDEEEEGGDESKFDTSALGNGMDFGFG